MKWILMGIGHGMHRTETKSVIVSQVYTITWKSMNIVTTTVYIRCYFKLQYSGIWYKQLSLVVTSLRDGATKYSNSAKVLALLFVPPSLRERRTMSPNFDWWRIKLPAEYWSRILTLLRCDCRDARRVASNWHIETTLQTTTLRIYRGFKVLHSHISH